jgi:NAD(P)-dependent dehydrogenase (short-subunit alcohol dehydrogenase family)
MLRLGDLSTTEMNEVFTINTLAPFILNSKLKVLMAHKHPDPDSKKFIINVSAMEGSFSRINKTDRHPHTNAAKAALNMMTRTSASDYKKSNIYMISVDTG